MLSGCKTLDSIGGRGQRIMLRMELNGPATKNVERVDHRRNAEKNGNNKNNNNNATAAAAATNEHEQHVERNISER